MTTKNSAANAPLTVVANDPDDMKGTLKSIGGSQRRRSADLLLRRSLEWQGKFPFEQLKPARKFQVE